MNSGYQDGLQQERDLQERGMRIKQREVARLSGRIYVQLVLFLSFLAFALYAGFKQNPTEMMEALTLVAGGVCLVLMYSIQASIYRRRKAVADYESHEERSLQPQEAFDNT